MSKYIGVKKKPNRKNWEAYIRSKGKATYLGSFKTAIEAARAYDIAAESLRGKGCKHNNIDKLVIPKKIKGGFPKERRCGPKDNRRKYNLKDEVELSEFLNDIKFHIRYDKATGKMFCLKTGKEKLCKGTPYKGIFFRGYTYPVHVVAYAIIHNKRPAVVDHINRDKHDNRIENLRAATQTQNCMNRGSTEKKDIGSKYKGVSPSKKRWRAYIQGDYLGTFKVEEDAAKAYNKEALKRFGKFAKPNKIEDA